MSLNRVCIMGRITRDLELRRTQDGTAVTSFTVAVDDDFKSKATGEKKTYFLDVVAWRHAAEFACQYLGKGRMVVVDGKLTVRDWTDKNGNKRRSYEVIAENVYFADSKRSESDDNQKENFNALSWRLSDDFAPALNDNTMSDIPF